MAKTGYTTAQLRSDIDKGRAGSKVDYPDPATAPLGTDDEAAGTPPSPEAIKLAHQHEIERAPVRTEGQRLDVGVTIYVSIMVAVLVALTAVWLNNLA